MNVVAILGFIFAGLGGLFGLTMISDILRHVNYSGQAMAVNQIFELMWCSGVVLTFSVSAILYVVADRFKKAA
jgi:hypothetical protein